MLTVFEPKMAAASNDGRLPVEFTQYILVKLV